MIYALVTLYNPKDDVIININNISKQVDKVFIYDNSINSNVELSGTGTASSPYVVVE